MNSQNDSNMTFNTTNTSYNIIKEDPELLKELVDKYVKVCLIRDCTYIGFVHSIDPVTNSMILSIPQGDVCHCTIIPGHAILDVSVVELPAAAKPPERKQQTTYSKEELILRKNKLVEWFKLNLVPVEEFDDKISVGNVCLLPPYSNLDLYTENPIVAGQIKKIMELMPVNF